MFYEIIVIIVVWYWYRNILNDYYNRKDCLNKDFYVYLIEICDKCNTVDWWV